MVAREHIFFGAQVLLLEREQRAEQFANGIARRVGHEVQAGAYERARLFFVQAEIEHGQRAVKFFIVIFGGAIFLHAEPDVFAHGGEVGLDDPLMPVTTAFAENKGVRPSAPFAIGLDTAFGAANDAIDQRAAASEPNATGLGIAFEKFAIGNISDGDDLVHAGECSVKMPNDEARMTKGSPKPNWSFVILFHLHAQTPLAPLLTPLPRQPKNFST